MLNRMNDNASPCLSVILTLKRSVMLISVTNFASESSSVNLIKLMRLLGTPSVVKFISLYVYEYYQMFAQNLYTVYLSVYYNLKPFLLFLSIL
jgi:hypothetical protein